MSSDPAEISASDFWLKVLDGALFPGGMAFMGSATVLLRFVASMTPSTPVVGMAGAGVDPRLAPLGIPPGKQVLIRPLL